MIEMEAKVALSQNKYQELKKFLEKNARRVGESVKSDYYYKTPESLSFRIREAEDQGEFTIKQKVRSRGVETNRELSWLLKDVRKWKKLLKKWGTSPDIGKKKKSLVFQLGNFHIELNTVKGLGHYLEVERIGADSRALSRNRRELIELFESLGFRQSDFETQYYTELLKEKTKA
jgi:predicted adenylyl cyclase CyaB